MSRSTAKAWYECRNKKRFREGTVDTQIRADPIVGLLLHVVHAVKTNLGVSKKSVPGTGRHLDVHVLVTPLLQTSKSRTQTFWTHPIWAIL